MLCCHMTCPLRLFPMLPRKQCQRLNVPGHAHALTFSCFQRRSFLSKDRSRQWVTEAIGPSPFSTWLSPLGLCHHAGTRSSACLADETEYSISAFLNTIKQSVSKRALSWIRDHAPEFLDNSKIVSPTAWCIIVSGSAVAVSDRNVVEPATVHHEIEYIHRNPVKRGLCTRPEEWHWSSAADYAGRTDGPLRIDLASVPPGRAHSKSFPLEYKCAMPTSAWACSLSESNHPALD